MFDTLVRPDVFITGTDAVDADLPQKVMWSTLQRERGQMINYDFDVNQNEYSS